MLVKSDAPNRLGSDRVIDVASYSQGTQYAVRLYLLNPTRKRLVQRERNLVIKRGLREHGGSGWVEAVSRSVSSVDGVREVAVSQSSA